MDRKHKKKRSFLSRAKKFASRGLYGKGKNIDEETYHYYVQVMKRLNESFEDEDEKGIFVENVFIQTTGSEVELVCNQLVSRVLEKILPYANPEVFQRFADALSTELRIVSTDPFASHVLEKMMKLASEFIDRSKLVKAAVIPAPDEPKKKKKKSDEPETVMKTDEHLNDEKHLPYCTEWLLKVSRFAMNNMEEFVADTYASHVVRTMLQCVSGVNVTAEISKSKKSRDQSDESEKTEVGIKTRDKVFLEILQEFTSRIMSWPQFGDLAYLEASAATIQTLLLVLAGSNGLLLPPLLDLLWSRSFFPEDDSTTGEDLPQVFQDPCAQRTLEIALSVSSISFFTNAYEKLFKGRMMTLCEQESKFAVIGLLSSCNDKERLNDILEELEPKLKDLLAINAGGVIVALAKTCKRIGANQTKLLTALFNVFDCGETEETQAKLVPLLIRLPTAREPSEGSKTSFAGSQLVQTLLHFSKPIKVINSLLSMSAAELRELFCDPCGSFIMDAFVSSPSIGEKSRDRLRAKLKTSLPVYVYLATSANQMHRAFTDKLSRSRTQYTDIELIRTQHFVDTMVPDTTGEYAALASSKHGSRAFDCLWAVSDIKSKAAIGQELLTREAQVSGNQWGSIIFSRYAISLLKKRKSDWEVFQGQESKKRKLFKDFLTQTPDKSKDSPEKKKKREMKIPDENEVIQ